MFARGMTASLAFPLLAHSPFRFLGVPRSLVLERREGSSAPEWRQVAVRKHQRETERLSLFQIGQGNFESPVPGPN